MAKYRQYRQQNVNYKSLRVNYEDHLRHSRGGWLSNENRERLLFIRTGEKQDSEEDKRAKERDFWSRLKRSGRDAFVDYQLFSEIAGEEILNEVFYADDGSPLTSLLNTLFSPITRNPQSNQEWRTKLALDVLVLVFEHTINGKLYREPLIQKQIVETLHTLSVKRYGQKVFKDRVDEDGDLVIEQVPSFMSKNFGLQE